MSPRRPRRSGTPLPPLEVRVEALEHELRTRRQAGDAEALAETALGLAHCLADAGRLEAAISVLADSAAWAHDHHAPELALRLLAEEAALEFDAGRLGHARAHFDLVAQAQRTTLGANGVGVLGAATLARYGLALEAEGRHREAVRHFGAALLDGDGPGAIERCSAFLLDLAEGRDGFAGAACARAAREGFRIVADEARASRADELLRRRTRLAPDTLPSLARA